MLELSGPATPSQRPLVRPIRTRTLLAAMALSASGLMALVQIVGFSIRIVLLHRVQSHVRVSRAALHASDAFLLWGARIQTGIAILTAVTFLLWFYRAYQNLFAFRPGTLSYSPGQAVGSFFIPFVNIAFPFFVMREIWQASDPTFPPYDPRPHTDAPTSLLVPAWWMLFLGRNVLGWLALLPRLGGSPRTLDTLLKTAEIMRVELSVSIIAAGLACTLVLKVGRRQEDLASQLAAFEQAEVF